MYTLPTPQPTSTQHRLTGNNMLAPKDNVGAPRQREAYETNLYIILEHLRTTLARSANARRVRPNLYIILERLGGRPCLELAFGRHVRPGQIRGGTLPCLSQRGEGFLLEFDFALVLSIRGW